MLKAFNSLSTSWTSAACPARGVEADDEAEMLDGGACRSVHKFTCSQRAHFGTHEQDGGDISLRSQHLDCRNRPGSANPVSSAPNSVTPSATAIATAPG